MAALAPAHAEQGTPPQTLSAMVVTAPMQDKPLTVITDPKAPRQPVPASDGADFLKAIPGFSTIRKGGSNGDPMLRGMAGSRLNILVDGGQVGGACPSRMDPPTAYVSPQLYDRVTVIKGPQTVLYGPGNSAGTVLFERDFKRYASPGIGLDGSLLGGSAGRNDQMVDLHVGTPEVYMAVDANHTHAQDYQDGDGNRVHSSWDRWNANAALGWTPDDNTRVELSAGKGNGHAAYAFSGMDGAQFLHDSAALKLEHERPDAVFSRIDAQLYYNYIDHVMDNYTLRQPDPSSMMPMAMASDVDRRTVGGRVAATFEWSEALSLVAGMDGNSSINSSRMGGPPGGMLPDYRSQPWQRNARMSSVGLFGELSLNMAERNRLISGARMDRAQVRGYNLALPASPAMGSMKMGTMAAGIDANRSSRLPAGFVRYEHDLVAQPATFYAGLGYVQRFPDYWELFGGHVDRSLRSFLQLQPEQTTQLDVGLQYNDTKLKAWVSGYLGVVRDFIVMNYGTGMTASQAGNVNARTAGGEAGLVYSLSTRWKADATLAWAWGRNQSEHRPLPQMPPLETRLGLTYDTGIWSVGGLWRIAAAQHRVAVGQGNIVGQDLGPSAGFGVFSLNGGYRFSRALTLSAGIDNLFDKTYAEHVNAASIGLVGYVNTMRVNEPGRTLWLKLDFKY